MAGPDIPEEKNEYQIAIVRIDDFPKPSATSEMITRIAGAKHVFNLTNAQAYEMRAHIGQTLSRDEFVELWRPPALPLNTALDLLDDLFAPN
jgi:hypothetical protein